MFKHACTRANMAFCASRMTFLSSVGSQSRSLVSRLTSLDPSGRAPQDDVPKFYQLPSYKTPSACLRPCSSSFSRERSSGEM